MFNVIRKKHVGIAVMLIVALFALANVGAAFATTNDATEVGDVDGWGISIDSGTSVVANDASVVFDLSAPTNVSAAKVVPIVPRATGELVPGGIYTTPTSYSIAQGQYITYSGSWTPTSQSFDVGIYNTATGNYTWFNRTGGTITNYNIIINNSSTYKIAYRNPSANSYNANFNITYVIS
jgi:hypothetical protein